MAHSPTWTISASARASQNGISIALTLVTYTARSGEMLIGTTGHRSPDCSVERVVLSDRHRLHHAHQRRRRDDPRQPEAGRLEKLAVFGLRALSAAGENQHL